MFTVTVVLAGGAGVGVGVGVGAAGAVPPLPPQLHKATAPARAMLAPDRYEKRIPVAPSSESSIEAGGSKRNTSRISLMYLEMHALVLLRS
jgi:hypothetical protein